MARRGKTCGIGINDADYITDRKEVIANPLTGEEKVVHTRCIFFTTWRDMLYRCYSENLRYKYPTYKDCTVCEEWHLFSNFKAWMETQDWEGNNLDKDILYPGNKIYSPETCVFVSKLVNSFLVECNSKRGGSLIGASSHIRRG